VLLNVYATFSYVGLVLLVEAYIEEVSVVVVYPSSIGVSDVKVMVGIVDQCLSVPCGRCCDERS
jgi:hypothetical protein